MRSGSHAVKQHAGMCVNSRTNGSALPDDVVRDRLPLCSACVTSHHRGVMALPFTIIRIDAAVIEDSADELIGHLGVADVWFQECIRNKLCRRVKIIVEGVFSLLRAERGGRKSKALLTVLAHQTY